MLRPLSFENTHRIKVISKASSQNHEMFEVEKDKQFK